MRGEFLIVASAGVVSLGCGEILDVASYRVEGTADAAHPPAEAAASDSGYMLEGTDWQFASRSCGECLAAECRPETTACGADPTCDAYERCVARCSPGDAACGTNCERGVQGTFTSPAVYDLIQCGRAHCLDTCGSTQGGCVAIPGPGERDIACCQETNDCLADPECRRLFPCYVGCQPWDQPHGIQCLTDCGGPEALTNALQQAFWGCYSTKCSPSPSCEGIGDDGCLDSVAEPIALERDNRIYIHLSDFASLAPLPSLRVQQCSRLDWNCSRPIAAGEGTTDHNGDVSLPLQRDATGRANVYFLVTGPSILTQLIYAPASVLDRSVAFASPVVGSLNSAVVEVDPSRGAVAFATVGCGARFEAGVAVTITPADEQTRIRYIDAALGIPSSTATSTDASGLGLITRVLPPTVQITAIRAATGVHIGTTAVHVRPNAVTVVRITPTPAP